MRIIQKLLQFLGIQAKTKQQEEPVQEPRGPIHAFSYLQADHTSFFLTSKKQFSADGVLKPATIQKVFDFAYDMSFGEKGKHRSSRSGGSHTRKNGEIFANTFQGKIAECAACNFFYQFDKTVYPDFSTHDLGVWDTVDLTVMGKEIAVKSTKQFGQLLLLETQDWNKHGEYIPNIDTGSSHYDALMLIRLKPSCEDLLKGRRLLYSDVSDKNELRDIVFSQRWEYDFVGYITNDDLRYIINQRYILPKGSLLNGKTPMDAENYYVQSGSLRDMSTFGGEVFCSMKTNR